MTTTTTTTTKLPTRVKEENDRLASDSKKLESENKELIRLLWDYLKPTNGYSDRCETAWGSKTKQGLVLSIKQAITSDAIKASKAKK